ncbi:MAG: hypothetical protein CL739_08705 [Chloroflexi bacterium]|nr:hypothetical protein [Chloroflexota bacterium]|tara:strand:- start:323 stop:727 length:405 start_codon:yes stop_codon:yes gene_type:complete
MTDKSVTDFLREVHIAILSINRNNQSPHSTPVWYTYEANDTIWFMASPGTKKSKLMSVGTHVSLVAQTVNDPYKYVSIEGHILDISKGDLEQDLRPISRRYLGDKGGDEYVESFNDWNSSRYTIEIDKIMTMGL